MVTLSKDRDLKTGDFIKFQDEDKKIEDILTLLRTDGAWDNLANQRIVRKDLRKHIENIFHANYELNADTERTNLLKSHIIRTEMEIFMRAMEIPVFDVDPTSTSKKAFEQKEKSSITKSLLEWFMRVVGYEDVYNDSKLELTGYGDTYRRPFVRNVGEKMFPSLEDKTSHDLMIDPNATYLVSESYNKKAQYIAWTGMYLERNLVNWFGDWILDYAEEGYMIDDQFNPQEKTNNNNGEKFWEVLEIQDIATGQEFVLVGSNAFPVVRNIDGDDGSDISIPKELRDIIEDEDDTRMVWTDEYKYKNSIGENILTAANNYFYYNPNIPYNWGIAHKLATPQILHEQIENLKTDNIVKRLDQTPFIAGGPGGQKMAGYLEEYRRERRINRNAFLIIPGSLSAKAPPQPGVLKFEGLSAQEGQIISQDILEFVKNTTGVSAQRQEVQKNTGVGQTEIIEEQAAEAIEAIAEKNITNFKEELKMFVYFMIAHEGFGLSDVLLKFTKYDEDFPEGLPDATISVTEAVKKIKDFEFDVIIDRASLVKKSRSLETSRLLKLLQLIDPTAMPKAFKAIINQVFSNEGLIVPEEGSPELPGGIGEGEDNPALTSPQGGLSQFQPGGAGAGPATPPGPEAPSLPPIQ